jgi:hypothetical protein
VRGLNGGWKSLVARDYSLVDIADNTDSNDESVRHITKLKIATRSSCRSDVKYLQAELGQADPKGKAQQSIQVKRIERG